MRDSQNDIQNSMLNNAKNNNFSQPMISNNTGFSFGLNKMKDDVILASVFGKMGQDDTNSSKKGTSESINNTTLKNQESTREDNV